MTEITHAHVEDAAKILALQKLAYQSEARLYDDFSMPSLTQTLEEMRDEFTGKVVLKAEIESEIVGSVRAFQQNETCHIRRLCVHPERQGRGLGTELMRQIETCFPNATRFELFTGYKSVSNIRLYERLGYTVFKSEKISEKLTFVFLVKAACAHRVLDSDL